MVSTRKLRQTPRNLTARGCPWNTLLPARQWVFSWTGIWAAHLRVFLSSLNVSMYLVTAEWKGEMEPNIFCYNLPLPPQPATTQLSLRKNCKERMTFKELISWKMTNGTLLSFAWISKHLKPLIPILLTRKTKSHWRRNRVSLSQIYTQSTLWAPGCVMLIVHYHASRTFALNWREEEKEQWLNAWSCLMWRKHLLLLNLMFAHMRVRVLHHSATTNDPGQSVGLTQWDS